MNKFLMHLLPIQMIAVTTAILSLAGCHKAEGNQPEAPEHVAHKILVTSPVTKDIVRPQPYVCQIHSRRHIDLCALEGGYLEEIMVKEGQIVKKGDVMFTILPTLYKAKLAAEKAEVDLAQIDYANTNKLFQQNVVAQPEVALSKAKLEKAEAKMKLAEAELNFATVRAPFDGIIDHQHHQHGSLIAEGDVLTTLSDNDVMWAYFNVPESDYLEYQADKGKDQLKIELVLANGNTFPQNGTIGAIEADFNNETGNIAFRGDFPNPDRVLRHGQTGTIMVNKVIKDAVVIPQRAKFEILAKNYVFVVEPVTEPETPPAAPGEHAAPVPPSTEAKVNEGHHAPADQASAASDHKKQNTQHGIVHQREIETLGELDDIYLIKGGLNTNERIVLEGIRQVRDGDKVEYEYVTSDEALSNLKYHAE